MRVTRSGICETKIISPLPLNFEEETCLQALWMVKIETLFSQHIEEIYQKNQNGPVEIYLFFPLMVHLFQQIFKSHLVIEITEGLPFV